MYRLGIEGFEVGGPLLEIEDLGDEEEEASKLNYVNINKIDMFRKR